MTDIEKQREAIEAARRWEEDMAVHRMELQNMAAHKMELQTAKQKATELTLTIKVDTSQLEKAIELINKLIEKSEKIQSLTACLKENNHLKKEK